MAVNRETLRLIRGMRLDIDSKVDAQTTALAKAWLSAWNELSREWDSIVRNLVAQSADGGWPSQALIYRSERVLEALSATQDALEDLSKQAGVRIIRDLPDVTSAAAEWQARLIAAQMPTEAGTQAVLAARFNRVDPAALEQIVTRTTQQVTSLLQPLSGQAMASMHATLIQGVALGDNPRATARAMVRRVEGAFSGGLNRALVIARTETLDAHRDGSYAQDQANADVLTAWEWHATLDRRTCPSCLARHGTRHDITEHGPEDHQQGRCARVPVTKTWAELGFTGIKEPEPLTPDARAWFAEQPADVQTQIMGPARLQLLNDGQVRWDDLTQRRVTPGWRDSWTVTPVKDLAT